MKKIISLAVLVLFFTACQKDDVKEMKKEDVLSEVVNSDLHRMEIIINSGHLHGENFHANGNIEGFPLKKSFHLTFEKKDKTWQQVLVGNENEIDLSKTRFPMLGNRKEDVKPNSGERYSFEIIFYDKDGNRLNKEIAANPEKYQLFITTNGYYPLKSKEGFTSVANNGKDFVNYIYRDTNPEDKMFGRDEGVELRKEKIGLKGYMAPTKWGIAYNLNLRFYKWEDGKGEERDFNELPSEGAKQLVHLQIPVDVISFRGISDEEVEQHFENLSKYYGIDKDELEDLVWGDNSGDSSLYWM